MPRAASRMPHADSFNFQLLVAAIIKHIGSFLVDAIIKPV